MAEKIHARTQVNLDQVLREGPSLVERTTKVAIKALGTNPADVQRENFYLKQTWDNLKSSLVGFSTYGIMDKIEVSLASSHPGIQIEHFKKLAEKLGLNVANLPVDQLPLGIHAFARLSEEAALRELWKVLGREINLPELTDLKEIKAWFENPANADQLNSIEKLDLSKCNLKVIPSPLAKMSRLKHLNLSSNELNHIPEWLGTRLESLLLSDNLFYEIPKSIEGFTMLQELDMNNNQISSISDEVCRLTQLKILRLTDNQLTKIPDQIEKLSKLESLWLSRNQIDEISEKIGSLTELKTVGLSDNQIDELPKEMARLDKLEMLLLTKNKIRKIPVENNCWKRLKKLTLGNNQITEIPKIIFFLNNLNCLLLKNNRITEIPPQCRYLTKLNVQLKSK